MKIFKNFTVLVGIIIFVIFALPLFGGILNVGNTLGLALGTILIISGKYIEHIVSLIKLVWKRGVGKMIIVICATIIIICASLFGVALGQIFVASKDTATNQTTVIVLGCRVVGDEPSVALRSRTNVAIDYLKSNPDAVAILSGGKGEDENISEAQCMANLMIENGIDKSRLYLEDKSTNTYENITFSKEIIEKNNLSTDVIIATSDYHQKRASMLCKQNGLNSFAISARSGKYSRPTYFVREACGIIQQWFIN